MDFNDYKQTVPASVITGQNYPLPTLPDLKKRRLGSWFWLPLTFLAVIATVIFLSAVYFEVNRRDAELKYILGEAQKQTTGAIIEQQLLGDIAGKLNASSTVSTSTGSQVAGGVDFAVPKDSQRLLAERAGRPQIGNASSSLVIVEFADFECPICLQEFPIIRAVTNKYAKDILFIYRNYPVVSDNSTMLAQVSLCANEQGKFWPLHDRLFSSQGQMVTSDDLKKVVLMSGVNWTILETCVNSEKYKNQVLEDMSDALDLGINGTPTFFINGKKLEGVVSMDAWDQIIAKYKELNGIK